MLQFTASFQYSVGDAGGSYVWFCGFLNVSVVVFMFLPWCVLRGFCIGFLFV